MDLSVFYRLIHIQVLIDLYRKHIEMYHLVNHWVMSYTEPKIN
jgi:hypothetical protein